MLGVGSNMINVEVGKKIICAVLIFVNGYGIRALLFPISQGRIMPLSGLMLLMIGL